MMMIIITTRRSFWLAVLATVTTVAFTVPRSVTTRSQALYGVSPRSPRPEQYYDTEKSRRAVERKFDYKYDPEYDDDIAMATRKLFDLRMRKSQKLPIKSHEFRELRKFIARLKTQKRIDELRAMGVDPKKRKPKTRREREKIKAERIAKEDRRRKHRERIRLAEARKRVENQEAAALSADTFNTGLKLDDKVSA